MNTMESKKRKKSKDKNKKNRKKICAEISAHNCDEYFERKSGTTALTGNLYEMYFIMNLYLKSMQKKKAGEIKTFKIAYNLKNTGICDDVYLLHEHKGDKKSYFFQLKQGKGKNPVKFNDIIKKTSGKKDKSFHLHNYFASYSSIRMNPKFKDADIQMIHLCTMGCNFEQFLTMGDIRRGNESTFFTLKEDNLYYQITPNGSKSGDIREYLLHESEIKKLATAIVDELRSGDRETAKKNGPNNILRKYYKPLTEKVFEKEDNKYVLRKNFIHEQDLQEDERLLRTAINEIEEIKDNPIDNIWIRNVDLSPESNNQNTEENLPADIVTDETVKDFLSKFHLLFGQPDLNSCEAILTAMLEELYPTSNKTNMFLKFKQWMEARYREESQKQKYITETDDVFPDQCMFQFQVRKPVSLFTGREEQLEKMYTHLSSTKDPRTPAILHITGLGGIGKTELTRQFIAIYGEKYQNIICITCEDEHKFQNCFTRLATDKLNIKSKNSNGENKQLESIIEDVYRYFKGQPTLTILDDNDIYKCLSLVCHACSDEITKNHIIMTSRKSWKSIEDWKLQVLTDKEAEELLRRGLSSEIQANSEYARETKELLLKTQKYPLVLTQAIGFIKVNNISITEYLDKFNSVQVLDSSSFQGITNEYFKTTYTVWKITVDELSTAEDGQIAYMILKSMAYMDAENIDIRLFHCWRDVDEAALESAVRLLIDYSLINEHGNHIVSIHKLVQDYIRRRIEEEKQEQQVMEATLRLFPDEVNDTNVSHALSVWKQSEKFNFLDKFCSMPAKVLEKLCEQKRYGEAYSLGRLISSKLTDIEHTCTHEWHIKFMVAHIHKERGEYKCALEILNVLQEQDDIKKIIKKDLELATIYEKQSRPNDVYSKLESILTKMEQPTNDIPHLEKISIKFKLAEAFNGTGEYEKAKKQYEEIKAIIIQLPSILENEKNRITLKIKYKNAVFLMSQGEDEKALEEFKNVHEEQKKQLGETDEDTLRSLHNIGCLQERTGSNTLAKETMHEVIRLQGEEEKNTINLEVIESKQTLSAILTNEQKYPEAIRHMEPSRTSLEKEYGECHPLCLSLTNDIASNYYKQGDIWRAEEMYKQTFAIYKDKQGLSDTHPHVCSTKYNIGLIHLKKQQVQEAYNYFLEVLTNFVRIQGEKHYNTKKTKKMLKTIEEKHYSNYSRAAGITIK